jgi:pyruvate dehydrogenase E2 component (dihydrolipoamide acetyltransferase)
MRKDVKVPEISENVTSGKIVEVLVKVGDTVAVDDVLVEMETEKAVVEIPSPYAGQVSEILAQEGEEKKVGEVIARIEVSDTAAEDREEAGAPDSHATAADEEAPAADKGVAEMPPDEESAPEEEARATPAADAPDEAAESALPKDRREDAAREADQTGAAAAKPSRSAPAAPSVRRLARELGVGISAIDGSGPDGRISAADVHAHVKQQMLAQPGAERPKGAVASSGVAHPPLPDFSRWGSIRTAKIDTVRRLTAENTGLSWQIVPHVTQFDEADITDLGAFIDKHGRQAEQQGGKLTLTAVVMKVCAAALVRFPRFNASIDMANEKLIYKDYVHIGLAVDTPRGLLVPVIRDVQDKGIIDLAVEIVDAAGRARDKKLKPEEFEGGTFTISNQGGIGGVGFTPVVVWPQAAILGISRSRRMPLEKDGQLVARTVLPLSMSYDHRIADGADAARFLDWIARSLEQGLTVLL